MVDNYQRKAHTLTNSRLGVPRSLDDLRPGRFQVLQGGILTHSNQYLPFPSVSGPRDNSAD